MADMAGFPYPLDAMPMFVLQVAPVEAPGRSCEGSAISPASLLPPQRFLSHYLSPCLSCSLSLSFFFFLFCVDTRVKPPFVLLKLSEDNKYGMKCHLTAQVAPQLTPHKLTGGEKKFTQRHKFKSTITFQLPEIYNLLLTLSCLYERG